MQLTDTSLFRQQGYIDGGWVDADHGSVMEVTNPASGETLGTVPSMGPAETARAIDAADAAWAGWRANTAAERAAVLWRWHHLLLEHQEDLARLMTAEQGKPLAEARGEIVYAASFLEWFAEEGRRVYGDTIPAASTDQRIVVIRQPVGVCAAVTPWNFPAAMITRKAAPALAAGCTMVVKPASATPFSALALAALAEQAGEQSPIAVAFCKRLIHTGRDKVIAAGLEGERDLFVDLFNTEDQREGVNAFLEKRKPQWQNR